MRSVRNKAFAAAGRSPAAVGTRREKSQFFPAFWGALLGAVVSLGGVWLQSHFSDASDLKRAEREAVVAILTIQESKDQGDFAVQLKLAMNMIRYAAFSNAVSLKEQADFLRQNSYCENNFTEECKNVLVQSVAAYRRQLRLDPVSAEDLRILLDQPLKQMEAVVATPRPSERGLPGALIPGN